jgi:hypothetical protein
MGEALTISTSTAAQTVAILHNYGLKPPPEVTTALAALQAATEYHGPDLDDLDALLVNAKASDVPGILEHATRIRAERDAIKPVRQRALDRLGRRCAQALRENTDLILAALAAPWAEAAAMFEENYSKLPADNHSADALVEAGTEALDAHIACRAAARSLQRRPPRLSAPRAR